MRFKCGLRKHLKLQRLQGWHKKFAWFPIHIKRFDCRWLEFVERKGTRVTKEKYISMSRYPVKYLDWEWEYR